MMSIGLLGGSPTASGRVVPKPDVLARAFTPDFTGTAADKRYRLRTVRLGTVHLPSGKLVTLDPWTYDIDIFEPLALTVPPERYPVDLAIADTGTGGMVVALARIGFSQEPVAQWRIAHTASQDPATLRGDELFGYRVDSGMGAFADPATVDEIDVELELEAEAEYEGSQRQKWFDAGEAHAEALGIPYGFALDTAFVPGDIAMFATGWGDGNYASWVGYDAADRPVCVVTDFAVIEAVEMSGI